MMNGVNFGMDGLALDNTLWYNPKTEDSFKVRSNYFEDNNMILQAYDGRRFNMSQLDGYVQVQSIPPKRQKPAPKKKVAEKNDELPPEVASLIETPGNDNEDPMSLIDPEDLAIISGSAPVHREGPRLKQDGLVLPQHKPTPTKTPNQDIIERALKDKALPDFNVNMKWTKFPDRELQALIDVMQVPVNEITEYYMGKISTEFDNFLKNMKEQLGEYIKGKLSPEAEEPKTKKPRTNAKTKSK